jgi:hypothetical protein
LSVADVLEDNSKMPLQQDELIHQIAKKAPQDIIKGMRTVTADALKAETGYWNALLHLRAYAYRLIIEEEYVENKSPFVLQMMELFSVINTSLRGAEDEFIYRNTLKIAEAILRRLPP